MTTKSPTNHLHARNVSANVEWAYIAAANPVRTAMLEATLGADRYTAERVEAEMGPQARAAWEKVREARKEFLEIATEGNLRHLEAKTEDMG